MCMLCVLIVLRPSFFVTSQPLLALSYVGNIHFHMFVGPCPHKDKDYRIRSKFQKNYLIKISFTFGELVSLVKVFRLFRLE